MKTVFSLTVLIAIVAFKLLNGIETGAACAASVSNMAAERDNQTAALVASLK